MTPEMVVSIGRDAVLTMLLVSAPMLLSGLLIGLVISILQAITQVHEMTLTFIPKIVVVAVSLIIFLPWIINVVTEFTIRLFGIIPTL
ncbi:MAG: flagellar biosynthetic protein FliQ [candidate division Zixibacteria bacterium HGW-Zixibacteria-1]|nr:MAG: flagellar biosynthetic protein FliQ [candidate division Zixibacteria bacterium HGW-Zixibacteria-1]